MCQLGHRVPQYLIKHYICLCLWRCFQKASTWICGLSKTDYPWKYGWAWSNPLRTWIEQKNRGKKEPAFFAWWLDLEHQSFLILNWIYAIGSPSSQALGLRLLTISQVFLGLQFVNYRSQDFLAPWNPICLSPFTSISIFVFLYMFIIFIYISPIPIFLWWVLTIHLAIWGIFSLLMNLIPIC